MAKVTTISGVNNILGNIKKYKNITARNTRNGLVKGGLFLQRESQMVVPVDLDILKPSADTRNVGGPGFTADVVVSYTTEYAVYVHENLDARHKPGKRAKYLEGPAREKKNEIFQIVANEIK
jgi:hypothetical protein